MWPFKKTCFANWKICATHPSVAVRMSRGDLQIYGWVYKLETGEVFGFSPEAGQFVSLREQAPNPPRRRDWIWRRFKNAQLPSRRNVTSQSS